MCLVAHCLAVKFLPLSRELFVIGYPKTKTTSLRIIIVQRNLCFKVPLGPHVNYIHGDAIPSQTVISGLSFPKILEIPALQVTSVFEYTNQIKSCVYAFQSCLLFPYVLP
jgi:hypothetical protein